ncbi:MAG: GNVR domain-containing protein [Candidatus Omnitrophota bacterium]
MENLESTHAITPIDYIKIIFRRKWLLLAAIYIGLISGIVTSYILPKSYESSTLMLVEEGKIINPIISSLAVSTKLTERMRSIQEQILSWNSLTQMVKALRLDNAVKTRYEYENLILSIRKRIKVLLGGQNIIKISFEDANPAKAQAVVKTLTEILVNQNIEMQNEETDDAINFINDQLKLYKKKILEGKIAKMQDDLDNLLIDSTENHPSVKDLRNRINKAKEDLAKENFDSESAPISSGNDQLKGELKSLRDSLDLDNAKSGEPQTAGTINEALYKMLLVDKIDTALSQDVKIDENIYNILLQKLEVAKITKRLDVSTQGTKYIILDPPRLPIKPTKPNKLMVVFIGIFLGAAVGAGLVLLMELMDHSLVGIEEAKACLNYPILGGISRIITAEDLLKEKNVVKKRIVFSLTAGISLVMILMVYSFINGK